MREGNGEELQHELVFASQKSQVMWTASNTALPSCCLLFPSCILSPSSITSRYAVYHRHRIKRNRIRTWTFIRHDCWKIFGLYQTVLQELFFMRLTLPSLHMRADTSRRSSVSGTSVACRVRGCGSFGIFGRQFHITTWVGDTCHVPIFQARQLMTVRPYDFVAPDGCASTYHIVAIFQ